MTTGQDWQTGTESILLTVSSTVSLSFISVQQDCQQGQSDCQATRQDCLSADNSIDPSGPELSLTKDSDSADSSAGLTDCCSNM